MDHIYEAHHPEGEVAKQRKDSNSLFPSSWTRKDIEKCIRRVWKQRLKTRKTQPEPQKKTQLRGRDPQSGLILDMWYNHETKTIETAYPPK